MAEDILEENIQNIIRYFKSGFKSNCTLTLGVELEHFLVYRRNFRQVTYYDNFSQKDILEALYHIDEKNNVCVYENNNLIGLDTPEYSLSLEPAGQFEISIRADNDIEKISNIYQKFINMIRPILSSHDMCLINLGYSAKDMARNLPLIPRLRYERMLSYFNELGGLGENMMKATCSLQVSVDYFSEEDFVKKYRVGIKTMPILKFLAFNSPFFETRKNENILLRTLIWNETDWQRCKYPVKSLDSDFSFYDYAQFVLEQKIIYYPFSNVRDAIIVRDLLSEKLIDEKEMNFILSMVFPEIRLKKILELRGMDSISLYSSKKILAIIKSVFSSEQALDFLDKTIDIGYADIYKSYEELSLHGVNAVYAGRKITELIDFIVDVAIKYAGDDKIYLTS